MPTAWIRDRHEAEGHSDGKRWQARWRDDQNRNRAKAFTRKADAERFIAGIEHGLNAGTYRDPREGAIPFDDFAATWLHSQHHLRESTKVLHEGIFRNHLIPHFGSIHLNRIRTQHGRDFLSQERPPRVREIALRLLKSMLNAAVNESLLPHNPLSTLRLAKTPPAEPRFLTIEQLDQLANHINPHFKTLVLSAGYLGLRQGELFGLRPNNLLLGEGKLRVVEQLLGNASPPARGDLKTKASRRTVTIPAFLIPELEEQLAQRASTEYVFTAIEGGPIHKSVFNRRYWQPTRVAAGHPDLRFHDLRHTAAAIAIQTGASPKAIQARLGHSSIEVTFDRYGHLMPGLDEQLASGIDQLVASSQSLSNEVIPHPAMGFS